MQNAADAAALGAAQLLADNVVYDRGQVPEPYIARTSDVLARATDLMTKNRGGTVGQNIVYTAIFYYGNYNSSYQFDEIATYDSSRSDPWQGYNGYDINNFVPFHTDAVQIRVSVDNPTTFASVIGVKSLKVEAIAAAGLIGDPNHIPQGPTWPMTSQFGTTFASTASVCNPVLFYNKSSCSVPPCPTPSRFENLVSLAAAQGCSFADVDTSDCSSLSLSGLHAQLIGWHDGHDARSDLPDIAPTYGIRSNATACPTPLPPTPIPNMTSWSPSGSCSGGDYSIRDHHGIVCCRSINDDIRHRDSLDVSDIDVPNWIIHDFAGTGLVSLIENRWRDLNPQEAPPATPSNDWRSASSPPDDEVPGDWLETYLSTNAVGRDQVIRPINDYINDPNNGTNDVLATAAGYGKHVDKVMYLYDNKEVWRPVSTPTPVGSPTPPPPPVYEWRAATGEEPDRVHMVKAMKFRFYSGTIGQKFFRYQPYCGGIRSFGDANTVYAIPVGEVLDKPPCLNLPCAGHSLYNYVSLVSPSP